MNDIELNFTYTKEQIVRAYRFQILPGRKAKMRILINSLIIFGITGIFYLFHIYGTRDSQVERDFLKISSIVFGIISVLWLLSLLFIVLSYYYFPDFIFKNTPAYHGNHFLKINNDVLIYTHEYSDSGKNSDSISKSYSELKWDFYTHHAENDEFIFLYKNRSRSIIPKTAFKSETDMNTFKKILENNPHIQPKRLLKKYFWEK